MSGLHFTALIRLPFQRRDFVDPPQATWDAVKDRELWRHISISSKTKDLDWVHLANTFNVPPTFLLQQAAWLYERHLDHVRAQMKKVGGHTASAMSGIESTQTTVGGAQMKKVGGHTASAMSGIESTQTTVGGVAMARVGSGGPAALSTRQRDSPISRADASTPAPPPLSRTPSTNTITQSRALNQHASSNRNLPFRPRQRQDPERVEERRASLGSPGTESPNGLASSSSSSSASDSDNEHPATRSQLFKRPPRFRAQRPKDLATFEEDDDIDESSRGPQSVLPFAHHAPQRPVNSNVGHVAHVAAATSNRRQVISNRTSVEAKKPGSVDSTSPAPPPRSVVEPSSSLASSASDAPKFDPKSPPGPLSPNHRAELARLSPRRAGVKSRKDGSEGTLSMGSSFSDIDDTSISQSALEEALLSNIQHGRMSTLSQLRSRYL